MAFGIAVLGLDHWYTAFGVLDTCAASPETPLVAVYEPDAWRRAEVSAAYPGVLVTDNVEQALDAPDVELAAICARTGDAVELAKRALFVGKHVVSVKPFARTVAEAEEVLVVAAESGRFFGSFEGMQRLHPRAETLRQIIESGAVGDIVALHQVGHGSLPAPWRGKKSGGDSWWLDSEQVPGGAWIDHAIYAVDLARFALQGEITQIVGATVGNRSHESLSVEDYGAALLTLETRSSQVHPVTCNITNTWCAEPGAGYSEYRFIGTRGTITAEAYAAWIVRTASGETRHEWEPGAFLRFDRLARILQNGEKPPFGADDARCNLATCLQFYEVANRWGVVASRFARDA